MRYQARHMWCQHDVNITDTDLKDVNKFIASFNRCIGRHSHLSRLTNSLKFSFIEAHQVRSLIAAFRPPRALNACSAFFHNL